MPLPTPSVLDASFIAIALAAVVIYFVLLPVEARKVRDGDPPTKWWKAIGMRRTKDDHRTPEAFVADYRRRLKLTGWWVLASGAVVLALTVAGVLASGIRAINYVTLSMAVLLISQGAGSLLARRILGGHANRQSTNG